MDDTNQNDPMGSTDNSSQADDNSQGSMPAAGEPVATPDEGTGETTPEPTMGGEEAPAEGTAEEAPASDDSSDQAAA